MASLTWALHEVLDRQFPNVVERISVVVAADDDNKDAQPINMTNCLRLQYQVCTESLVFNESSSLIKSYSLEVLPYCYRDLKFASTE